MASGEPGVKEEPRFTFLQYGIAFHLAAEWCGDDEPPELGEEPAERAMRSFEDDMLLFAHRDEPPFRTRIISSVLERVDVRFPQTLVYEAEGRTNTLHCVDVAVDGRRRRSFGVSLAETYFEQSRLGVLTIVLEPIDDAADSQLNEYDVIKLVKLWEGGEGVKGAKSALSEKEPRLDVSFGWPGEETSLHALAIAAFPGWEPLGYRQPKPGERVTVAREGFRVGTVELEVAAPEARELFADIANLQSDRRAPTDERWDRAVAVGGVLQGLLDFRAIEPEELADVFATVDVDAEKKAMRAFHKGTLLSLTASEPEDDSPAAGREARPPPPLGVDPYLIVPNIVLLHNEQRLKTAVLRERDLSERQHEALRRFRRRAGISETENALGEIARRIAQHLPNVFHYASERELQRRGQASRGLDDLETFVRLRIDDLTSVLQSRMRRRDRWTAVLGIAVGVVTAFLVQQAVEGRPLWLIVPTAAALFVAFLWLREKLF
jgi:hypothetical protein